MKLQDITIGGRYAAKVSGGMTIVRVLAIRESEVMHLNSHGGLSDLRRVTRIDVVNERTGRTLTFRSASRLRRPAPQPRDSAQA